MVDVPSTRVIAWIDHGQEGKTVCMSVPELEQPLNGILVKGEALPDLAHPCSARTTSTTDWAMWPVTPPSAPRLARLSSAASPLAKALAKSTSAGRPPSMQPTTTSRASGSAKATRSALFAARLCNSER